MIVYFEIIGDPSMSDIENCLSKYEGSRGLLRSLKIESIFGKKMSLEIEKTHPKLYGYSNNEDTTPSFIIPSLTMIFQSGNLIEASSYIKYGENSEGSKLENILRSGSKPKFYISFSTNEIKFSCDIKTQTLHH